MQNENKIFDEVFQIDHCIGKGGQGIVYAARDTLKDENCVLKIQKKKGPQKSII